MRASDIMTSPAVTVGPDTSVAQIAQLLFERRISAVPVIEEGRLAGLVSEADLLHRREIGTDRAAPRGSWWLRLFSADSSPAEYVKSHAQRARDIMTRDVVTVTPDTPVAEIASLLETHGIKRVPVLRDGRLAGIVSRSNLVQALAVKAPPEADRPEDDHAIRAALLAELERQPWWRRQVAANVIVEDGIVHLWGMIESEDERQAARVAAENIPGVLSEFAHLKTCRQYVPCRQNLRGHARQGSTTLTPQSSKSAVLRVASVAPVERAIAAICASACEIGRPARRRSTAIRAYGRAASLAKARMRPLKSSLNIASAALSKALRRRPAGKSRIPCRISDCVMLVVYRLLAAWARTQRMTFPSGAGFISSDRTLVSTTITCRARGVRASARAPARAAGRRRAP